MRAESGECLLERSHQKRWPTPSNISNSELGTSFVISSALEYGITWSAVPWMTSVGADTDDSRGSCRGPTRPAPAA